MYSQLPSHVLEVVMVDLSSYHEPHSLQATGQFACRPVKIVQDTVQQAK
jgi:hypothetical protein